jgi:hypothetical protein
MKQYGGTDGRMISVAAFFQNHKEHVSAARRGLFSFSENSYRKDRKAFPKHASRRSEQDLPIRGLLSHTANNPSYPQNQSGRL